mmetsp:Transcript_1591/g.6558  ORF Transcript_1591/g.6558 Transcript_1591/m.6558 type:complete len:271 (+) Transcript_1591:2992-3804(+)
MGTSRWARHSRKLVLPQPFWPRRPYRRPMVISMSQSLMSSRPFMPMEKLLILMSREVGRDARLPVTVRLRALLVRWPEAAMAASCAATDTPFIASSRVVISSSPFCFLPDFFSFSAFLAARSFSFWAFFSAFLASFSAFSAATLSMSAAASASSFAFFSASSLPSSLGSSWDSSISAALSAPRIFSMALGSLSFLSALSLSSNTVPASFLGTKPLPALFGLPGLSLSPSSSSSSASASASFFFLPMGRLMIALGLPSSSISGSPPSSSSE